MLLLSHRKKRMLSIFKAIIEGNLEMVKCIFEESPESIRFLEEEFKWTPLEVAIAWGEVEIARYLWGVGGRLKRNAYNGQEWTPVHHVASLGKTAILDWVFENGILEYTNVKTSNGWTPIDVAIASGKLEMVKFLWDMGGRPNLEIYRDRSETPVHDAACCGETATLKWAFTESILPLCVLNIKNYNGWTPLDEAIFWKKWEFVALFRRLMHLDPVFLAMQRAKRDFHQMLRRLPDELLDMVVDEVAARHRLKVVW